MCATFNVSESTLERYFGGFDIPTGRRDGDVFPSDRAAVLAGDRAVLCKWGFSRFDKKGVLINARAETVTQKPTFSDSFIQRRCVVPVDAFYEWDTAKRKHRFARVGGAPFFLCGFYRREVDGERFIVLTKPATSPVSEVHDRIPVIATDEQIGQYMANADFARRFIALDTNIDIGIVY